MLNYKFLIPILLLNSYLFSSSINLDLKNYLNKDINSTLIKPNKLKSYYLDPNIHFYWVDENGLKNIYLDFINLVKNDPVYKPNINSLFKINELENKISKLNKSNLTYRNDLISIELLLTEIYDKYTNFLLKGSIDWESFKERLNELKLKDIDAQWDRDFVKKDNRQILKEIIKQNDISIISKKIDTNYPNKEELVKAISILEKVIETGDYKKLPAFKTLKIGNYGKNVKLLRQRLLQSNDLQKSCENNLNVKDLLANNINSSEIVSNQEIEEDIISNAISCEKYYDEERPL